MTTRFTFKMTILSAAFAAAGFAQTPLTATVGFAFVAQGAAMESGFYSVIPIKSLGGRDIYLIRHSATKKSILVKPLAQVDSPSERQSGGVKLVFHCKPGEECHLAQIWDGRPAHTVVEFPAKDRDARTESIEVALARPPARGL